MVIILLTTVAKLVIEVGILGNKETKKLSRANINSVIPIIKKFTKSPTFYVEHEQH